MAFRLKNNAYQQRSGINYSSPAKETTKKVYDPNPMVTAKQEDFAPYKSLAAKKAAEKKEAAKQAAKKVETNKNQSSSPKKDPYAEALKKDAKLGDYVKARKGLKKDSPEYAKLQNKINAAYGVKKRYNEGPKKEVVKSDVKKAEVVKPNAKDVKKAKVKEAKTELKTVKKDNKQEVKDLKKTNKVEKINAKADVATAKGKDKRADRLKARAERKATGKSKKDQGRNIFGRKTKKQKAKEAKEAAMTAGGVKTVAKKKTAKYN